MSNEWISVNDKLPETSADRYQESDIVLCMEGELSEWPFVGWYCGASKLWNIGHHSSAYRTDKVKFWMPLPPPPKEK